MGSSSPLACRQGATANRVPRYMQRFCNYMAGTVGKNRRLGPFSKMKYGFYRVVNKSAIRLPITRYSPQSRDGRTEIDLMAEFERRSLLCAMRYMIVSSEATDDDVASTPVIESHDVPLVPAVGDEANMSGTQIDGRVISRRFDYRPEETKIVLTIALS